jgi:uncharacterized membrane protein
MAKQPTLGNRIANWRFIMFFVALFAGCGLGVVLMRDDWLGIMLGFDAAAGLFLLSCAALLAIRDPAVIRRSAEENDANRRVLLALTGIVMTVLLVAIAAETANVRPEPWTKVIIIVTLLLAWLFSNMVYALHYAHMAYLEPKAGCHGLDFPNTPEPVYWDFVYFAFAIGMTFQTSDVTISSDRIRRVVTVHSFAAFVFNIGVLAFTINVLGSS